MKTSLRDKTEGTMHQVKGKIKEVAGELINDPKLQADGASEKFAGKVQEKIGKIKKAFGK